MKTYQNTTALQLLCLIMLCMTPLHAFALAINNQSNHTLAVGVQKKCLNVIKEVKVPPTSQNIPSTPFYISFNPGETKPQLGEKTCLTFRIADNENIIDDKSIIIAIKLTENCIITYNDSNQDKLIPSSSCHLASSTKPVPVPHKNRLDPSIAPTTQ